MSDLYLDIGSTNIKWKYGGQFFSVPFIAPVIDDYPFFEVDVDAIVCKIKEIIGNTSPNRLFISVQMHGYVLLNKGKTVTNYISWRDERGKTAEPNFTISFENGTKLKNNLPRLSVKTQRVVFDEFCTLGSYIARILTGYNVSHITDTAASGFYNVVKKTEEQVGFVLPKAFYEVSKVGYYKRTAVYTPVGDQQAAILGTAAYSDCYIINVGTAAQICCLSDKPEKADYESRPFFYGKTLCTVTGLTGGRTLVNLSDDKAFDVLYKEYSSAIDKLPRYGKIIMTGGTVKYRKVLFEKVLQKLNMPYSFNKNADAIAGLERIAKESKENL